MGEKSKSSGEIGEKIANSLLELIGWKDSIQNISIDCTDPSHLNDAKNPKESHGEDEVYLYYNPFQDDTSSIIHVSVKHSENEPPKEKGTKTQFLTYFNELQEIIECAQYSSNLETLSDSYGTKNIVHSGLLIWLNCYDLDNPINFIDYLANIQIPVNAKYPTYLIDSARALFLIKVMHDIRLKCSQRTYEFRYPPEIGSNLNNQQSPFGNYLPIELIASDIIPIVIFNDKQPEELILYANQTFTIDNYEKLISYALSFSSGFVNKIKIGLPKYDVLKDKNDARLALNKFPHRDKVEITPFSFNTNIQSIIY